MFHFHLLVRYVRMLGALYMRLTGTAIDCYKYLEPLYNDYRKIKSQNRNGGEYGSMWLDLFLFSPVSLSQTLWVPLHLLHGEYSIKTTSFLLVLAILPCLPPFPTAFMLIHALHHVLHPIRSSYRMTFSIKAFPRLPKVVFHMLHLYSSFHWPIL